MISVVVLTLDEADNLPRCLESVRWADDLLVVDSGSKDGTQDIARTLGARVIERRFDTFAGQRNFAMEAGGIRGEWCLHLDADEVVTPELRDEILALVRADDRRYPVWRVAARILFMGRWLRHAGMYPAYQVRFGRSDALRFIDHGHGQREVQPAEQVGTLAYPLDHYNFSKGVNDWLRRHLRYARDEAEQMRRAHASSVSPAALLARDPTVRRRALKQLSRGVPFRGLLGFLYIYVLRRGFLDGRAGLVYARMYGLYQSFVALNLAELDAVRGAAAGPVPRPPAGPPDRGGQVG